MEQPLVARALAALLPLVACSSSTTRQLDATPADATIGDAAPADAAPADATIGDAAPADAAPADAPPAIDLTREPFVWFAPLPPLPGRDPPFVGSGDFMDLFTPDAPWAIAASHVQAFKLYGEWLLPGNATDGELARVVADLDRRRIPIAFEGGPLAATETCGQGVESFAAAQNVPIARRVQQAGGELRLWAMDEPFYYGSVYAGPQACRWSADKVAAEAWKNILAVRQVFSDLLVGEAEPLGGGITVAQIVSWWDTYRAVTGEPLAFVQVDVNWGRPQVFAQLRELEDAARARGIPIGIIADGDPDASTDAAWVGAAEARVETFELEYGGRNGQITYQSWNDRPDFVLPESSPAAFTHIIDQYFRPRPTLSLAAAAGQVTGTLAGAPGGATVSVSVHDLAGPGVVADVPFAGTVPAAATHVSFATRINMECDGCAVDSRVTIYGADFGAAHLGPDGWGMLGTGSVDLVASDSGPGMMLVAVATRGQALAQWSPEVAVTAGAPYRASLRARIPPSALGSGFLQLVFTDDAGNWVGVQRVEIGPAVTTTSAVTDGAGRFAAALPPSDGQPRRVEARLAGTEERWPAYARLDL